MDIAGTETNDYCILGKFPNLVVLSFEFKFGNYLSLHSLFEYSVSAMDRHVIVFCFATGIFIAYCLSELSFSFCKEQRPTVRLLSALYDLFWIDP